MGNLARKVSRVDIMHFRFLYMAEFLSSTIHVFRRNRDASLSLEQVHQIGQHTRFLLSLSKNINPSLVLVQPRKTSPFITERLLMGRKESNQTKQDFCTCHILVNEPQSEISNNVVCATIEGSDQPARTRSLIRAFASRLNIL